MRRNQPGHKLEILWVTKDELQQNPANANNGDVDAIEESIAANGVYQPVIVQRSTGYILVGNHRYLAMVKRGMEHIPVIYLDVDDLEAKRIMVADNRTSRLAYIDEAMEANLLEELHATDLGLAGTGYTFEDYSTLMDMVNEPLLPKDWGEPEPEPPLLSQLNFSIMPVIEESGEVHEFLLSRANYRHLSANDMNIIRQRLGQEPLTDAELATYDVPSWRKG